MNKRMKKKRSLKVNLAYSEWLYKEERDYNSELTVLLEECLPFINEIDLKGKVKRVVDSSKV